MSKHVWRGTRDAIVVHPGLSRTNCTVIEDAACFPVREAMQLCKAVDLYDNASCLIAIAKYRKAAARMNALKGKRK